MYYIYHHSYYLVVHLSVTNEHIAYINIKIHEGKERYEELLLSLNYEDMHKLNKHLDYYIYNM